MDESQNFRRSGRRRIRPVEFWNFEKPEDSTRQPIYNEVTLSRHSIFNPFSLSFCESPEQNTTGQRKRKVPASVAKEGKGLSNTKSKGKKRRVENGAAPEKAGESSSRSPTLGQKDVPDRAVNGVEDASVAQSFIRKSYSSQGSFSDLGQHQARPFNLSGKDVSQNAVSFEQPSFRNVLSSTAIEAPGKGAFKVPKVPVCLPQRKPSRSVLKGSVLDPSMLTIPEQQEEEEEEEEKEKEKEEEYQQQQQQQQQHKKCQEERLQGKEKGDGGGGGGAVATGSVRKRARAEKGASAGVSAGREGHERGQEDAAVEASHLVRRSSRVRTRPLEYWNFEKVEVKEMNGEMCIIHHKQDASLHVIHSRMLDCTAVAGVQAGHGFTLTDSLMKDVTEPPAGRKSTVTSKTPSRPSKSPRKSAKSPGKNGVRPAQSPGRRRTSSSRITFPSPKGKDDDKVTEITVGDKMFSMAGADHFSRIGFFIMETEAYKCYVGHSLQNKERNIYFTYLLLERGHITWTSSRRLIINVVEGEGRLSIMKKKEGHTYTLKPRVTVKCDSAVRLYLKKSNCCHMLQLNMCWIGLGNAATAAAAAAARVRKPSTPKAS